jgi:hypothetical protein
MHEQHASVCIAARSRATHERTAPCTIAPPAPASSVRGAALSLMHEQHACVQGSSCPPSGFCGEKLCGSYSKGIEDRGTACRSTAASAA